MADMEDTLKSVILTINNLNSIEKDLITRLYDNTLYEPMWDTQAEYKLLSYIDVYNSEIKQLKKLQTKIATLNNSSINNVINTRILNAETFIKPYLLTILRHLHYLIYRTNRPTIICQISKVSHKMYSKLHHRVFECIATHYDNIPLLDERGNKLSNYYKNNADQIKITLKQAGAPGVDVSLIFSDYVDTRIKAYELFNHLFSTSKSLGYDQFKNYIDEYCNAEMINSDLENFYKRVTNANARFDKSDNDDYHIIMDERAFNYEGIYESWFTLLLDEYNKTSRNKRKDIKEVKCIPNDANVYNIKSDGSRVFAKNRIYAGDIIEICPVRIVNTSSLYSEDMRDIIVEIVKGSLYVVPFGYYHLYKVDYKGDKYNCICEWDNKRNVILIKANDNIDTDDQLIIKPII